MLYWSHRDGSGTIVRAPLAANKNDVGGTLLLWRKGSRFSKIKKRRIWADKVGISTIQKYSVFGFKEIVLST